MARKRIGLFMSEITQFFQKSCGKALMKAARDRDMDLIIYASYGSYSCPYGRNLLSEIGKKNIIHLPDYASFDAIVVLPNTFDIPGMDTEFFELVREQATCPVICLQNDFTERYPEFYSITVENSESMYAITKHIIEAHGFTDICYMSGPFNGKDSPARMKGFRQAMDEAGLPVDAGSIYEGNYWMNRGAQAIDHFMEGREHYPEAIICANDFMALSVCDELKKRGIRVPEDVAVTGFDGIREGQQYDPPLTTVTIYPEGYAEAVIGIIDSVLSGGQPDHLIKVTDELVLRKSCGCHGEGKLRDQDWKEDFMLLLDSEFLLREAGRITGDYQNLYDIENSLSVANFYFRALGSEKGYLCFCDETDTVLEQTEQSLIFSDEMTLMQVMRADERNQAERIGKRFRRSDILPPECFDTEEAYIIFPLYYKSKEYGYLVLCPAPGQWPNALTDSYTNALSSALESNFYQKQISEYADIKKLSETDPLTGLNNRRGFENGLTELLAVNERESRPEIRISIASIDMDNLKLINDVYGHSEGDFALRMLADTLRDCIEEGEVCARFGGDEFSAILITGKPDRIGAFTENFNSLLAKAAGASGKPYPIHASVGISTLKGRNTKDIFECMQAADAHMYVNKRNYKKENG